MSAASGAVFDTPLRPRNAVIPAKAGTHFDFASDFSAQQQDQNGFRLSPE
ncbi:hypothetical protein [Lysobacter enzymogenes]|nr:hypothetical protein [Lysobacter enzymogenes]